MSPMPGESTFHKASPSFGRLKEALEKLEARDKYRAKTKSPSDGDDVRWYFSKMSLPLQEAAASVPATEVAGKGDFYRFSINDSLALEAAFLKQEEELVSTWWKEYAECSEGPVGPKSKVPSSQAGAEKSHKPAATDSSAVEGSTFDASSILQDSIELYENDEIVGVSVKGGLYEVDLFRRRCYPVYWTRDHRRVLRGHWFAQKGGIDWSPLREDISEQLEFAYRNQIWHRRSFQPSGKFAARLNLQGSSEGLYALFTGEDDTWEAWLNVDSSVLSMVLGIWGSGIKLRRGFAPSQSVQPTQEELNQRMEEERDDYCSQVPVRHLVFMVHGIGQRLENANFVDDVGAVRQLSMSLADQHLTSYQRNSQRVLFIPCQWRRGLKLSGEEAVESCTLDGVRALRRMLSATVHDVLYYMSPVYCQDIIDTVTSQLNKLYCKFIKRNPGYDGKVSIYGHSLGSVLSYDILCHQINLASSLPITKMTENREATKDFGKQTNHNGEDTPLRRLLESGIQDTEKSELAVNVSNGCLPARTSGGSMDNFNSSSGSKEERPDLKALREEIARLKEKLSLLEEADASKDREGTLERSTDLGCEENATSLYENASSPSFRSLSRSQKNKSTFLGSQDDSHEVIATRECDVVDAPIESNSFANRQPLEPAPQEVIPTLKSRSSSRKRYTPFIEYTKLAFEVDTFFAVGSPLGVFLSLRNIRIGNGTGKDYWQDDGIEEEMPACRRLLNIFHPFDPVAYRLEPLVSKEYLHKQPMFVPYHKGGKRIHIGMQEFGKDLSARSKAFVHSFATLGDQVAKFMLAKQTEKDDKQEVNKPNERTYGSLIMERLTGNPDGRIDYMLQDATFEHQYLQAISSHTSYWRDADTVLFILKHIYSGIPEKDPSSKAEADPERERENIPPEPVPLLNQTYLADEEVAFTFAEQGNLLTTKSDKNV